MAVLGRIPWKLPVKCICFCQKGVGMIAKLVGLGLLLGCLGLQANDGVGSVSAGGLVLGAERRVAMKKEKLFISCDQVRVDYEFLNESDRDLNAPQGRL